MTKKVDKDCLGLPADNTAYKLPAHSSSGKQLDLRRCDNIANEWLYRVIGYKSLLYICQRKYVIAFR
jgi:hypothetical protein